MQPRHWFAFALAVLAIGVVFTVQRHESSTTQPVQRLAPPAAAFLQPPNPTSKPSPKGPLVVPPVIASGQQTEILMYHYVRTVDVKKDPLGFRLSVTPAEFEAQLAELQKDGYQGLTMEQVAEGRGGPKTVAITFDDGYEDFYTTAWPLLKKYGFTATSYVISGKIGGNYMTWDQLRELHTAGIEIGAHTINHVDLSKLTPVEQRAEITGSKETIEKQVGVPVTAFCYPSGKFTSVTVQLTQAAGFRSATTTEPGRVKVGDNLFTLHRVRIGPGETGTSFLKLLTDA